MLRTILALTAATAAVVAIAAGPNVALSPVPAAPVPPAAVATA